MEFGEMKRNTSNWSNFCIRGADSRYFSLLVTTRYPSDSL